MPDRMQGRRERKRQRMQSHLAATAFELFEELGYDAVTMEQVAAEADVAKATLYNYFPMKEALVAYRFKEEIIEGMGQLAGALAAEKTFGSRMRFLLLESAAWHVTKRAYLPHYLRYINNVTAVDAAKPGDITASSVTWSALAMMFRAAQQSGEVSVDTPAEKLAWSFEFLLYGAVSRWLGQPESDLAEEFLLVFDLLMDGIATKQAVRNAPTKTPAKNPIKDKKS